MTTDTLRSRVVSAFATIGVPWPDNPSLAIALGGAAVQCHTEHKAGFVCDVVQDNERNIRNVKLMVYLCQTAGWPEPECDQWIGATLRMAAQSNALTRRYKIVNSLRVDMLCTKRQVTLAIEEWV